MLVKLGNFYEDFLRLDEKTKSIEVRMSLSFSLDALMLCLHHEKTQKSIQWIRLLTSFHSELHFTKTEQKKTFRHLTPLVFGEIKKQKSSIFIDSCHNKFSDFNNMRTLNPVRGSEKKNIFELKSRLHQHFLPLLLNEWKLNVSVRHEKSFSIFTQAWSLHVQFNTVVTQF